MNPPDILYEDNHLLVVNKPAGLATMGTGNDTPTLHRLACDYVRDAYAKPGKVFLGVVHRLDAMSSGVLVLARTSKAAARLSAQFRRSGDGPEKIYLAVIEGDLAVGDLAATGGHFRDLLNKNEAEHRMRVAPPGAKDAVVAELRYEVLRRQTTKSQGSSGTLVAVRLLTGRKHQIRVQFADRGHAVLGDVKYDAVRQSFRGIALHAWKLTIQHPTKATPMTFTALPTTWGKWTPTEAELQRVGFRDP